MNKHTQPRDSSRDWVYVFLLLGFLVSFVFGIMGALQMLPSDRMGHMFYDAMSRHSASEEAAHSVIVIDIDDPSLQAVGQWPWPRHKIASLVKEIAAKKPASIAVDILFSEPDRASLSSIKAAYKQDFGLDIRITGLPPELLNSDEYLGAALDKSGAVGASYFYFDHVNSIELAIDPEFQITGRTDLLRLKEATGVSQNFFRNASQLKFSGFINTQPDDDGMLRGLPLLIQYKGVIYPHLCLAAFMRAHGTLSASIESGVSGPIIRIGAYAIPVRSDGFALLRFNGKPELYPSIPAIEVLNGSLKASDIEGKIVLIGSSAVGLYDLHGTIFDSQYSGSKIQAAMLESMTVGNFVREPSWAGIAILVISVLCGLIMSALFIHVDRPGVWVIGTLFVAAIISLLSFFLFKSASMFISPGIPFLVIIILLLLFAVARFIFEKRRAHFMQRKLENLRVVTIDAMSAVAEARHQETGAHIKRTQHYVRAIAERLQKTGKYSELLSDEYIEMLFVSAPLHDIGKVGIPDNILLKPGKLSPEETEMMQKHAELGKRMMYDSCQNAEGDDFLEIAGEIALTHHEKWDGTGYPNGLAGQAIPLSGRIMAVADVYDALISERCYKPAFPHETARKIMQESRDKDFDPVVIDAFLDIEDTIVAIAATFKDKPNFLQEGALLDAQVTSGSTATPAPAPWRAQSG